MLDRQTDRQTDRQDQLLNPACLILLAQACRVKEWSPEIWLTLYKLS